MPLEQLAALVDDIDTLASPLGLVWRSHTDGDGVLLPRDIKQGRSEVLGCPHPQNKLRPTKHVSCG